MSDTQTNPAADPVADAIKAQAEPFFGLFNDTSKLPQGVMHDVFALGARHALERIASRLGVAINMAEAEGVIVTHAIDKLFDQAMSRAGLIKADGSVLTAGDVNNLKARPVAIPNPHGMHTNAVELKDAAQVEPVTTETPSAAVVEPATTSEADPAISPVPPVAYTIA